MTLTGGAPPGAEGGGIRNAGALTLVDAAVTQSHAGDGSTGGPGTPGSAGGGIFSSGSLTLTRTTVSDNFAGAGGRGLDQPGVNGFDAGDGGPGGGIFATGALTLDHAQIVRNHAGAGGRGGDGSIGGAGGDGGSGGGIGAAGTLTMATTLVSGNTAGAGGVGGTAGGDGGDGGANLGGAGCPGSHAAPRLAATGDPDLFSPAIDGAPLAGCPATDVLGRSRPQGLGCDVGAFEAGAGMLGFNPPSLTFAATKVGGLRRYTVTVTNTGFAGLALPKPIAVAGAPHFGLGPLTCGATVLGGRPCAVTVDFMPKRAGTRTGTLTIGTRTFGLRGTGYQCVVPTLEGKTITQARKLLRKAHCKLGKVVRSGAGRRGRIRSTTSKAGAKRPAGTRIRVVANRRKAH